MAESLQWYLGSASHFFTGLVGANVPATVLWENVMPPYNEKDNTLLQFLEGSVSLIGMIITTALMAETLNPFVEDYTMDSMYLLFAPYFMTNAVAKIQRWKRAVADSIRGTMKGMASGASASAPSVPPPATVPPADDGEPEYYVVDDVAGRN